MAPRTGRPDDAGERREEVPVSGPDVAAEVEGAGPEVDEAPVHGVGTRTPQTEEGTPGPGV